MSLRDESSLTPATPPRATQSDQQTGLPLASIAQVRQTFQQVWGYEEFRSPQGEIVQSLLSGQDALVVMPTGGGKSICFQLPALLQTGLTLVVSPLVALMENQVQDLRRRRQPAALLHSQLPAQERKRVLWKLEHQQLRLLYLSPETLLSPPVWSRLIEPSLQINGLILDEAHCLSQWGDSFRPAYYRLGAVRPALLKSKPAGSRIAIAAFTATADRPTQSAIRQVLRLQQPAVFSANPYRSNLGLKVQTVWTPRGRRQQLLQFLQAHPRQSGLVYVRTRRDGEALAEWLTTQGYRTVAYHAGLPAQERRTIEQSWLSGTTQFVVCTSAFGLGVNKPDCRWVVHFHAPILLSEYVQEIGRAGRDGKPAEALALVSEPTGWLDSDDQQRWKFFAEQGRSQQQVAQKLAQKIPPQGSVEPGSRPDRDQELALAWLQSAGRLTWKTPFEYAVHAPRDPIVGTNSPTGQPLSGYFKTRQCRWEFLLAAFGFEAEAAQFRCDRCDNCQQR